MKDLTNALFNIYWPAFIQFTCGISRYIDVKDISDWFEMLATDRDVDNRF